jgi:hypothetical protein
MEAVELGVTSAVSFALWGPIFWLVTAGVELGVTLRCRNVLVSAGRPAGMATLLLVIGLVLVVPMLAGYAGCSWSAQRSAAEVFDRADPDRALAWATDRGAGRVREELAISSDDQVIVELEALRTLARERATETGDGLSRVLERAWWFAVTAALDRALPERVTWAQLVSYIQVALEARLREELGEVAARLRSAAWRTLLIFLGLLVLVNGIAVFLIRRAAAPPGVM